MSQPDTAKYIVTQLRMPEEKRRIEAEYSKYAKVEDPEPGKK